MGDHGEEEALPVSADAPSLTSPSISRCLLGHLTSSSSSSSSCAGCEGGGLLSGTPCAACKSVPSFIHEDLVSACLASSQGIISHQADQRTATGSERTLTGRSPSGWQAIAHGLTGRHTLHRTAASAPGGGRRRRRCFQVCLCHSPPSLLSH